jgi:hypothetical protein
MAPEVTVRNVELVHQSMLVDLQHILSLSFSRFGTAVRSSTPRCCQCAAARERWRTVTYDTCPSASMCNHLLGCLLKLFIGSSAVRLDLFVKPLLPTSCALLTTRGVGLSLSIALPFDMKGAMTARLVYPRDAAACIVAH